MLVQVEEDPVRQRVFHEKLKDRRAPKGVSVFNYTEGVQKVRSEYFTFFGIESNLYEEISLSWQEHEKCGLVVLYDYVRVKDPHLTITKSSHNTKVFKIM